MPEVYEIENKRRVVSRPVPTPVRWMIGLYFFIAFFEPYLNGAIGSVTKYYIFLLMICVWVTCRIVRIRYYHITMLAWLFYKLISVTWSTNMEVFKLHILSQIGMIALFTCLTTVKIDSKTIDAIIKSMWFGSALIGFLSLFFNHQYREVSDTRIVLYLFGQEADPNNQAAFLVIGMAISIWYIFYKKRLRLLGAAILLINFYSLMQTGSRGGLVAVAAIILTFVLFGGISAKPKEIVMRLFIIAVVAVAAAFLAKYILPDGIFNRLFDFSSYEGGSGRDVLWANSWELATSKLNFIFGAGWGEYYGYNGVYSAVHNTLLSMLCDVGALGILLFFTPLAAVVLYTLRRKQVLPVMLFVAGMIPSFFVDAINKRFFWNSIIILIILYENLRSNPVKRRH